MSARTVAPSPSAAQRVRDLVALGEPLVMGGFYDGVSARLVERAGFPLAFMGGYAVAASLLGEPDIGLLTQAEMADAARRLCRLVSGPVLVEGVGFMGRSISGQYGVIGTPWRAAKDTASRTNGATSDGVAATRTG